MSFVRQHLMLSYIAFIVTLMFILGVIEQVTR